ncbi:MAG: AAA family ATPase [Candidatus Moduliflexus flocculans]|nr:AAA family ATPase [Candidatus Moduliflexus flocculans]
METNPNYVNLFGSIESTSITRVGMGHDRFHQDQGRLLPQGQRRLPGRQRPRRPGRAGRLGRPSSGPCATRSSRSRTTPPDVPLLDRPPQAGADQGQRQGGHDRRRLRSTTISTSPGRGLQEDLQDQGRVRLRDGQGREGRRRLRPVHPEDLRRGRPAAASTGRAWPPSSSTATRIAGRQKKLSTRFHVIADVIRESSYWAGQDGEGRRSAGSDVEKAIRERFERVSLIEDKIQEMIEEGTILIDTDGRRRRPGQRPVRLRHGPVHVRQAGPHHGPDVHRPGRGHQHRARGRPERADPQQGRPHPGRLPARASTPSKRPMSPDRLASPSSSPTAASTATAPPRPRSTPCSRALSGLPLRQDLAVTGSLNQKGEIQPIGGVNEKIEGFFDVCKARGLTGTQGVIIPHQNVPNLMLRTDVVDAVAARASSTSIPSGRSTRASRS